MKKIISVLLLLTVCSSVYSKIVNVSDFGVTPDTFQDGTPGVKQAIRECKNNPGSTLVFPKGRYDFWDADAEQREYFISNTSSETDCPSKIKNIGLLFEGVRDITVEGNGSLFVFHGKMITFAIDNSANVTIKDISVDFERPSMTEFTIDQLASGHMTVSVHPDSKYTVIDGKVRFYGEGWGMNDNFFSILTDTIQGTNVYSSWDPVGNSKATEIAPFRLKLENNFSNENYQVGQTLTTRSHIRDHVGVFVNCSKNVKLNNVSLHYMHGLGVVSQFSENLTYEKVYIKPSRRRTIAAFADGMHFSGCRGNISIKDCHIKGLHDDPINVHGTYLKIEKIHSPEVVTMRFIHGQTYGMAAFFENDTVAFIESETLRNVDFATIKSIERISDRQIKVRLSKPIPQGIKEGDCLENLTWTPSLHISGCRLEMTNTRGILITTPKKVVVENNYFYRTGMYAILIAADANSWYESGAVNDVLIRNNVFDACAYNLYYDNNSYVIAIEPENHKHLRNYKVHRNIRIEDNTFKIYEDNLILKARSTDNLHFTNNIIENTSFKPFIKNRTKSSVTNPSFKLEGCTNVKILNNSYKLSSPIINIECNGMNKADLKTEKRVNIYLK